MCRHDGQHGVKRYGKIPITTAVNNGAVKCRCSVKKSRFSTSWFISEMTQDRIIVTVERQ